MAATSDRLITVGWTGSASGSTAIAAAQNTASPASIEIKTLSSGANTITVPTGGTTPTACTIVPPTGNTTSIVLKGVSGDTGIRLHNTDPSSIAIDSSVTSFVLTAGASLAGVRLFWS